MDAYTQRFSIHKYPQSIFIFMFDDRDMLKTKKFSYQKMYIQHIQYTH